MIVTPVNVNGVRAAVRERSPENLGLLSWLECSDADVVCLQETRADDGQVADALAPALDTGWHLASAQPHLKGCSSAADPGRQDHGGRGRARHRYLALPAASAG